MDLSELATAYLGTDPAAFLPSAGPASNQVLQRIGHETHTQPLLASLFWEAFTALGAYASLLAQAGLRPDVVTDRQEIVVRQAPEAVLGSRYDLVVLDHHFAGGVPATFTVTVDPDEVALAASQFWYRVRGRGLGTGVPLDDQLVRDAVLEVSNVQTFHIFVTQPPTTLRTAVAPAPACSVIPAPGEGEPASVGVVATNQAGITGVTSADHAFAQQAQAVMVAGMPGTIRSRHQTSDSCFIEVPNLPGQVDRKVTGPLSGRSPGEGETASFDGAQSGSKPAVITGWDKGIPFEIQPWNRLRVLTRPVTAGGDSGAALVGDGDEVIGFAFDRTGYGAGVEYSSWIWAEFVYMAHGLQ